MTHKTKITLFIILSLVTSLALSCVDYGNAALPYSTCSPILLAADRPPRRCSDSIQYPEVRSCDATANCTENSTGFGFRSGSFSSWRPSSKSPSGVFTAQHQCTSPTDRQTDRQTDDIGLLWNNRALCSIVR